MKTFILTVFAVLASVFSFQTAALAHGETPAMTDDELTGKYCRDSCHEACDSKTPECIRGFDKCFQVCMGGDVKSIGISEGAKKLDVGADDCNAKARAYRTAQKFCDVEQNTDVCDEAKALQKEFEDCVKARANGRPQVAQDVDGVKKPAEGGAGDDGKSKITKKTTPAN